MEVHPAASPEAGNPQAGNQVVGHPVRDNRDRQEVKPRAVSPLANLAVDSREVKQVVSWAVVNREPANP